MLQQTQVPRVLEKYNEFLNAFPSVKVLAQAKLSDVLKIWSGLGYNRRGKYLHDAAKVVVVVHKGNLKKALETPLPGVGPYTRAAVRVFAYNEPHTMIETNIRAVYIHHFYQGQTLVNDADLMALLEKGAEGQDPRTWHWALMDYGVHIKKLHKNPARRSAQYTRQSPFEGSLRQVRGAILRSLHISPKTLNQLMLEVRSPSLETALSGLKKDGMIVMKKGLWRIA